MAETGDLSPEHRQWFDLGIKHLEAGHWAEGEALYRRVVAVRPDFADAHYNLAIAQKKQRKLEEAIQSYRQTLAIKPAFPDAWNNLGNALRETFRQEEAIEPFRQALALRGDFALAWTNLAVVYKDLGQLDAALACFDRGLALQPNDAGSQASRLYLLCFHPAYNDAAIHRETRKWNDRFARPLSGEIRPHDNDPSPHRRLRVGYVSGDFRKHCQSLFTMPLFLHHDRGRGEVICYSSAAITDGVTARLQLRVNL